MFGPSMRTTSLLCVVGTSMLLVGCGDDSPTGPAETPRLEFLLAWGSSGSGDGEFNHPASVTTDKDGAVWVMDSQNGRIQKFDETGLYLAQWPSNWSWLNVDTSGNLYAMDGQNSRVLKLDSELHILSAIPGIEGEQFCIDLNGDIYVAHVDVITRSLSKVRRYSSAGAPLVEWGSTGYEEGDFFPGGPLQIAVANGKVYVADTWNSRIHVFDSNGVPLYSWDTKEPSGDDLSSPFSPVVHNNRLYVAELGDGIIVFDLAGALISKWFNPGFEDGQFAGDFNLSIDANGNLYCAMTTFDKIQKFRLP